MYSILIKVATCTTADKWKYLYNDDGSLYQEDDLENVRLKVIELLTDHLLSGIKVVANKRTINHIVIEGNPDEPGVWLPEVTVEDDGKVLMVVNGIWDKSALPEMGRVVDVTVNGTSVVDQYGVATIEISQTDEMTVQEFDTLWDSIF